MLAGIVLFRVPISHSIPVAQAPTSAPYPLLNTPTIGFPTPRPAATPTQTPLSSSLPPPSRATPNNSVPPAKLTQPVALNMPPQPFIAELQGDYLVSSPSGITNIKTGERLNFDSLNFAGASTFVNGRWLTRNRRDASFQFIREVLDLTNNQVRVVSSTQANSADRIGDQLFPVIYNQNVYPREDDIYVYDILQQKNFPIVVRPGAQTDPKIGGRWLAYLDFAERPVPIRVHNLDTHEDFILGPIATTSGAPLPLFDISQNYVVWIDDERGVFDNIHIYDLTRRQHYLITEAAPKGKLSRPQVSGDYLAYGTSKEYMVYDLKRNDVIEILSGDAKTVVRDVQISGNRLVWQTRERTAPNEKPVNLFMAEIVR
jgi:hypothetical protein